MSCYNSSTDHLVVATTNVSPLVSCFVWYVKTPLRKFATSIFDLSGSLFINTKHNVAFLCIQGEIVSSAV
jgi:hypothetical protein